MALKKYIVDLMQGNPLNGISTYIDVLTLSTGAIIRKIKKYEVTGQENWYGYSTTVSGKGVSLQITDMLTNGREIGLCSHFTPQYSPNQSSIDGVTFGVNNNSIYITFSTATVTALNITDTQSIKDYFAQQYSAGTPVCVWYVLASETTEYITVPTGLSGTVDGYTTQTGTPTPTNPIYPTANTMTMWANYTPSQYNGIAFVSATGQPEQYNGGWS